MKRKLLIAAALLVLAAVSFFAGVWYAKKMFVVDWDRIAARVDASEREYLETGVSKPATTITGEVLKRAVAPSFTDEMVVVSVDVQKGVALKSITGARYLDIPVGNMKGLVKLNLLGAETPIALGDIKPGSLAHIYYTDAQKKLSGIVKISFLEPGLE